MEADRVGDSIVAAVRAASERATEMGDAFGRDTPDRSSDAA
jgi:hypothetical protein